MTRLLPEYAEKLLMEAAKTPVTDRDPNARIVAIDTAIKKIKQGEIRCNPCRFRQQVMARQLQKQKGGK